MTLLCFGCFPSHSASLSFSPSLTLSQSFKPISSIHRKPISAKIPARDRIIDFGKHKGKMLGTLPSKYLKWVSKNLRARDFEEWAKLADEVLQDPFYRDRLEWEFADKLLQGEDPRASRSESPVSDLLEISERFGWDNDDKVAWSRVDFMLLGTSKGGRIPRLRVSEIGELGSVVGVSKVGKSGSSEKGLVLNSERKMGFLQQSGLRDSKIEETGRLKKDYGLKSESRLGFLNRDSGLSYMGPLKKDFGLDSGGKLVTSRTYSKVSQIEEMGTLERDSEIGTEEKLRLLGKESRVFEAKKMGLLEGRKVGILSKGVRFYDADEDDFKEEIVRGRREQRRERHRLKRGMQMQKLKTVVGLKKDRGDGIQKQNPKGSLNPFPGRDALLSKVNRQN
ncbi:golgin family A protein [Tasmannia lanceolata]|uniref:golgin family A protein n=1 Tax=Tasmannia lanceolata TaxID=3420 RepID=UPI00406485FF